MSSGWISRVKILVTGGHGFLGLHLQPALEEISNEVFYLPNRNALMLTEANFGRSQFDQVIEVVRNLQPDVVIHLAAFHNPKDVSSEFSRVIDSNLTLGAVILESLPVNSSFIYCGSYNQFEMPEKTAVNFYALSRKLFSHVAEYFSEKNNIHTTQVILSDLYGPNDYRPKLIPLLFSKLSIGENLVPSHPASVLYPIYVKDAVSVIVNSCLSHSDITKRDVFLKPNSAISVKNLVTYANLTFVSHVQATPEYSDFQFAVPENFEIVSAPTRLEEGLDKTWHSFNVL
jgi:nucleoside-diphosphate-sugar epimerase